MNKEQILGRLLMSGYINIDELNILNKEKTVNLTSAVVTKEEQESGNYEWLDKLKRNKYFEDKSILLTINSK